MLLDRYCCRHTVVVSAEIKKIYEHKFAEYFLFCFFHGQSFIFVVVEYFTISHEFAGERLGPRYFLPAHPSHGAPSLHLSRECPTGN